MPEKMQALSEGLDALSVIAKTTVVLDTSVLMADPTAYLAFGDADVVIPLTVIDELDHNKKRSDDAGRNTRHVLRAIEDLRVSNQGRIDTPVDLACGGTLRIEPNGLRLDELAKLHLDPEVADHRIIAAALGMQNDGRPNVRLVSNDAALRIKAALAGLTSEEHTPGRIGTMAPHRGGLHSIEVDWTTLEMVKGRETLHLKDMVESDQEKLGEVLVNEFVNFTGTGIIVRRQGDSFTALNKHLEAWGLKSKSKEQACALELAMDPKISMMALRGHAGTGKSILAIAAGLEQVLEPASARYDQLMILRPMISVGGQDMGFLPGDISEKTMPWFAAVVDVMVALSGGRRTYKECQDELSLHVEKGKVALEPITFLRGRSLSRTFVVLDEAQNIEPSTIKTIVSRLGAGSKIVLTGDSQQIDTQWVSETTCGLNVAVDAFAGVDLFGQIAFTKGERSRLADLAAERL